MREELEDILRWDIDRIGEIGRDTYGGRVNQLALTDAEREEIVARFKSSEDDVRISLLGSIMEQDPCQAYRACVIESLESENDDRRWFSMEVLLEWQDTEALDLLFAKPHVQKSMGDVLAVRLPPWAAKGRLTRRMQERLLELFVQRFEGVSEIDWDSRPWIDLLAQLDITNEQVATTLLRLWETLPRSDVYERYTLLKAMIANPVRVYEPIFKKASKSKVNDLKDLGVEGLAKFQKE